MENYENRIVLFLDILGFKKIVGDTLKKTKESEEEEIIEKTSFIIETIKEMTEVAQMTPKETSKIVTQFSDSIVISFNADDQKEIPRLFFNLQRLIAKLIAREVLCRGAISYGPLYHKESLIFGPALVDAYETESQAALYPRVILDRSVLEVMKYNYSLEYKHSYRKITFDADIDSFLKADTDDKFYIDYFTGTMMFYEGDDLFKVYKNLRRIITNGLRFKNPNLNIKYGWMKNKYNRLPESLKHIDQEEELFSKRPDIEKFYNEFKPIK
ncbi:hypothetical protein EMN47_20150 [Prolixibacteraceae bacterium JC049]|nr:hypothetical protein [Prolixibacteraceae bacterium JC049]